MIANINDVHYWLQTAGFKFGDEKKIELSLSLIQEEFDEIKEAIKNKSKADLLDGVGDLFVVLHNLTNACGLTPEEIVKYQHLISQSNWSKFCESEEEAQATVLLYKEGMHPDKFGDKIVAIYEKVNSYYIVKRKADGKILKSLKYRSVEELLNAN